LHIKTLYAAEYEVVAVVGDDGTCAAEEFLCTGEETTRASRQGLAQMLRTVARMGLQDVPAAWSHEANKKEQIYEFRKGPLRLFYFKGEGRQIAVCTTGVRKSGNKADKSAVARAAAYRKEYFAAVHANTLEVMEDENE
jgi:hypothetical protein